MESIQHRIPTPNSSQLHAEDIFHSTARNSLEWRQHGGCLEPVVISAPSGFPGFSSVLQKHGFILGKPRNSLQTDELSFRKNLTDWMSEKGKNPMRAEEVKLFGSEMLSYLSLKDNLLHAMTPTMHRDEVFQSSLVHNLLSILELQPLVLTALFPVLYEASYIARKPEDCDEAKTILNQMKWLPNIYEEKQYVSSLLDLVENATVVAQKEIMRFLPDIIPERLHSRVGEMLRKLLDKGTPVVSSIMDCFSGLDISNNDWAKIRVTALNQMYNASLEDFPAYFGFLFRTEDPIILTEIITGMRDKLEITPIGKNDKTNSHMVDIVDKIIFCISINHQVVEIWTKLVKDDLEAGESIKSLDFMILLIFADSFKSSAVPLKLLFANRQLTLKLLDSMLEKNMPVLEKVFPTFLKICSLILRTKETKQHKVVEIILVKLFVAHGRIQAQEIASNLLNLLLTATTNGNRDTALRVFTELARLDSNKLVSFAPHLMSVIDCLSKFQAHQIRQLMNILAVLSYVDGNSDSERFNLEFSILLRKLLTHTNVQTRSLGVLGALATVHQHSLKSKPNFKAIKELLELCWAFVEREEESCCIFLDELGDVVQLLPKRFCVQTGLSDLLIGSFQRSCAQDQCEESLDGVPGHAQLILSVHFDANREMEKDRFVVVFEEKPESMSPKTVPALVRAIRLVMAKLCDGPLALKDIDIIPGTPVLIPDLNVFYSSIGISNATHSQKQYLGQYLVLAINYFRETVSAFAGHIDNEVRIKIWYRLNNIVELQKIFARHFNAFEDLPLAYAAEKSIFQFASNGNEHQKKGKPAKKKTAATKPRDEEDFDVDQTTELEKSTLKLYEDCTQSKSLLPFLRRLDKDLKLTPRTFKIIGIYSPEWTSQFKTELGLTFLPDALSEPHITKSCLIDIKRTVFDSLLPYPLVVGADLNFDEILEKLSTQAAELLEGVQQFSPDTLLLILLEMQHQSQDLAKPLCILGLENVLRTLCAHINAVSAALKANDVIRDKLEACLRVLFKLLATYFVETARREGEGRAELFHESIGILARRCEEGNEELSFPEALQPASKYILRLSQHVKNPSTAIEHLHLLESIYNLSEDDAQLAQSIGSLADLYLKTKWKLKQNQVEAILRTKLLRALDPLSVMDNIIDMIVPLDDSQDMPGSTEYQSCTKANFHMWYKVLISSLAQHCSKQARKLDDQEEKHKFWSNSLKLLATLVSLSSRDRRSVILQPLLQHTRIFLEVFIARGINLLPVLWTGSPERANAFTRSLQSTTRKIQTICEHSKVQAEAQLLKYVPLIKRVLETLVFRVREVLAANGVADAFWMGCLKHRNMDGDLVNSQMYEERDGSEERTMDSQALNISQDEANPNMDCLDDNEESSNPVLSESESEREEDSD